MSAILEDPILQTLSKEAEFDNLLRVLEKYWKELTSNPDFDIYEAVDGNYIWRAECLGILKALRRMSELSERSKNQFVLMHTASGRVILRLG